MWGVCGVGEGGTQILLLFQETSKSVEAMIGSQVSREFVNHSEASLAERKDGRLSGVGMMDGCSCWVTDEGTEEGTMLQIFFSYFKSKKSGRRRRGEQRESSKFF